MNAAKEKYLTVKETHVCFFKNVFALWKLKLKEKIKKETGEYPVDFLSHIDIVFDGKKGCNKITLNGKEVELIKE